MKNSTLLLLAGALLLMATACGDDESGSGNNGANNGTNNGTNNGNNGANNGTNNGANNGANNGTNNGTNNGGPPPPDPVLPDPPAELNTTPGQCNSTWLAWVTGWVVDARGFPVQGAKAQLCIRQAGVDSVICLRPGDTDEKGVFTVTVPDANRCIVEGTFRVLVPNEDRTTAYCHFDPSNDTGFKKLGESFQLHPTQRATAAPAGGGTVEFADGLTLTGVDPDHFPIGIGIEKFSAAALGGTAADYCFLDTDVAGIYAFSPEFNVPDGTTYGVTIPNTKGLADGTVDLYVLGGLDCTLEDGTHVEEGEWVKFGTGTVAGDSITSNDGLPCVGWLGYK